MGGGGDLYMSTARGFFQSMSTLMEACSKRVAGASRRLRMDCAKIGPLSRAPCLSKRVSLVPLRSKKEEGDQRKKWRWRRKKKRGSEDEEEYEDVEEEESCEEEEEEKEGVWRRRILMGEKCQPLDFSGAIYYDCDGRRLPGLPSRSPLRSPLPGFSFPVVVASENKAR